MSYFSIDFRGYLRIEFFFSIFWASVCFCVRLGTEESKTRRDDAQHCGKSGILRLEKYNFPTIPVQAESFLGKRWSIACKIILNGRNSRNTVILSIIHAQSVVCTIYTEETQCTHTNNSKSHWKLRRRVAWKKRTDSCNYNFSMQFLFNIREDIEPINSHELSIQNNWR